MSGVPIPSLSLAEPLLKRADIQKNMTPEAHQKLTQLLTNPDPEFVKANQTLEALGKEGYSKSMVMASVEIPKKTSVGVATFLGVNTGLAAQTISKIGTPAQQALWLNALNAGVFTYGFGLTEQNIGSDPRSIQTTFKKEIDPSTGETTYVLNGNKKYIGNAARVLDSTGNVIHRGADFLAIFAVDDPNKAPADRTYRAFMVPRTAIGEENIWHSGFEHNKLGLREVNNGNFNLKNVRVPEALMLGNPDEDMYKKLLGLLDITRLFVGAMALGTAEACIQEAIGYAAVREQNGGKIQQFQAVSHPLKRLEAKATAAKLLLMEGTRLVDLAEAQKKTLDEKSKAPVAVMHQVAQDLATLLKGPTLGKSPIWETLKSVPQELEEAATSLEKESKVKDTRTTLSETLTLLKAAEKNLKKSKHPELPQLSLQTQRLEEALQTVSTLVEPVRFGLETAMAKLFASELAQEASKQAIDTLGGNGYME
ncbi:MAG: acyl-CoA dehydrogenase, partial [Cyanobacteria bacterium]|nr:acyl-CoA dehydrogenase [Cyanobacteriota bacterium]